MAGILRSFFGYRMSALSMPRPVRLRVWCALLLLSAPAMAQAQVAFLMDVMTTEMCLLNNLDAPGWPQRNGGPLNAADKRRLLRQLEPRFPAPAVACLRRQPYPAAACFAVIGEAGRRMPPVGGGEPFLDTATTNALEPGRTAAEACLAAGLH